MSHSTAAQTAPSKPRLAIRTIDATPAAREAAERAGQVSTLDQILQGSNALLTTMLTKTGRFQIVSREGMQDLLDEQDLTDTGVIDPNDRQAGRAGEMAGAAFVAQVTLDNYQDVTDRTIIAGRFGDTPSERREIQMQATLKIIDSSRGTIDHVETITISRQDLSDVLPGVRQDGRRTNALIGEITRLFAERASLAIMDSVAPAKVVGYSQGVVTFNRGDGTGVAPGQIWEIFYPGEPLIDPDTGENLGSEEIHIGWAVVTDVLPKTAKARAVEDFGIDRSHILRFYSDGDRVPPGVDLDRRESGSASGGGERISTGRGSGGDRRSDASDDPTMMSERPRPAASGSSEEDPVRLAIFVGDVSPDVPDQKVEVMEAFLSSTLTDADIEVISRRDVLNAVSNLADAGTNRGTGDPSNTEVERLFSDQATVKSIAQALGADGIIVATITSLEEDVRKFNDPNIGAATTTVITTLSVPWKILSGDTGGSIAADIAMAREQIRQGRTLERSATSVDSLLRRAAATIGDEAATAMRRPAARRPVAASEAMVAVRFNIEMQDMNVPEVRKIDGEWTLASNRYSLEPMSCEVLVDGFLVGTVPGELQVSPGPHRVRIQRPGLVTVDRFMNLRDGMSLSLPMEMTEAGRRKWQEAAAFFETLRQNAQLSEAQVGVLQGFKDFLRQSEVRINTQNLRQIGGDSFWR